MKDREEEENAKQVNLCSYIVCVGRIILILYTVYSDIGYP